MQRVIAPPPILRGLNDLYCPEHALRPCYILNPDAWNDLGWREVLTTVDPKPPPPPPRRIVLVSRRVATGRLREIVTWPTGRPLDWRLESVPETAPEPAWYGRARELRAQGLSIRKIMQTLNVKNYALVYRIVVEG